VCSSDLEPDCDDRIDNDFDGDIDCFDSDCMGDVACQRERICNDSFDDDADGFVDCFDSDCAGDIACLPESLCTDAIDNDADTLVDCLDPDCATSPVCQPESACGDGLDNDLDGLTDCADSDCATSPACPEATNCTDGVDNDSDGFVDCADDECVPSPACANADYDSDGVLNGADCAALDAGAFADPPEVTELRVRKPAPGSTVAELYWTDMGTACGPGRLHGIVEGEIRTGLWADRGFLNATCLQADFALTILQDARLPARWDGYYYLVRVTNVCSDGTFGNAGLDTGALCD
jgi:hypothetical protein